MSNTPDNRVSQEHFSSDVVRPSRIRVVSATLPMFSFVPILAPSVFYGGVQAVRFSRLTHISQPIRHVLTWRPVSTTSERPPMKAIPPLPPGSMFANMMSTALPQPTWRGVTGAPPRLSEEFVECLRVMGETRHPKVSTS